MAKIPAGLRIEEDLVERLKNAIWYTGRGLSVTSVVEMALENAVTKLEKRNQGKPFPQRRTEIAKAGGKSRK